MPLTTDPADPEDAFCADFVAVWDDWRDGTTPSIAGVRDSLIELRSVYRQQLGEVIENGHGNENFNTRIAFAMDDFYVDTPQIFGAHVREIAVECQSHVSGIEVTGFVDGEGRPDRE